MAGRYTDWCRIRFTEGSDPELARALIPAGRALLGQLMQGLALGQLPTGVLRRALPDGSSIVVGHDGTTPMVTIDTTAVTTAPVDVPPFNLWAPRGFVVYPAWHDATYGVGLPIIANGDAGPYDAANTAPGLARARWTPGGACGEVLISKDKDAGYPAPVAIAVPMMFHPTRGPVFHWNAGTGQDNYDARPADGQWTSYRLELAAPRAFYTDENEGDLRGLFEAVNAAREQANVPHALNLPFRGFYHPGQVMAYIMQASGSDAAQNNGYPPTYTTVGDRLTKDGDSAIRYHAQFTDWTRAADGTGTELRAIGGVAGAVATWQADPTLYPKLTADYGPSGTLDVGARDGFLCAVLQVRDRWIQAGNQVWQSADADLPPISWMGFASLNLAWETFPCTFDSSHPAQPLAPIQTFSGGGYFTNDAGDIHAHYPRGTDGSVASGDPAMSPHVFCRGRILATAPRGGLVWGACVQAVNKGAAGTVDRLIALVHHPADQGPVTAGMTRYLRVWWADIPRRPFLRLCPQKEIMGEDATDDWGWKGGQLVDLGNPPAPANGPPALGSPSSLKYASQWRFAPDGGKAACLRDYGAMADYAAYGTAPWLTGIYPRCVELTLTSTSADVTASAHWHDYAASYGAAPLDIGASVPVLGETIAVDPAISNPTNLPALLYDMGAAPQAVDYDANGAMVFTYLVSVVSSWFQSDKTLPSDTGGVSLTDGLIERLTYRFVGRGSETAARLADLTQAVFLGCNFQTPAQNFGMTWPVVLDVRNTVIAAMGYRQRYAIDPQKMPVTQIDVDTELTFGFDYVKATPATPGCRYFTDDTVIATRLFRQGAQIDEHAWPSPDGVMWMDWGECYRGYNHASNLVHTMLPLAISRMVQGYYVERMGEWVAAYQVRPVPGWLWTLTEPLSDAYCDCILKSPQIGVVEMDMLAGPEVTVRGGAAVASVPLPDNDWLMFAKVV